MLRRLAACLGALALILPPSPVGAHAVPELPQKLDLRAEGNQVRVWWSAAPDDVATLAYGLKVVPERRRFVYENGELVRDESDQSETALLAAAEADLGGYLLQNVRISGAGGACTGELVDSSQLATKGAELLFTCPGAVDRVNVTSTTMTEIDSGYQTEVTVGGVRQALYTSEDDTFAYTFDQTGAIAEIGAPAPFPWRTAALAVLLGAAVFAGATAAIRSRARGSAARYG